MCTKEGLKNLLGGDADIIVRSKSCIVEEKKKKLININVQLFFFKKSWLSFFLKKKNYIYIFFCLFCNFVANQSYLAGGGEGAGGKGKEKKKKGKKEKEKKNPPCLHPKFEFATDVEGRLSNLKGGSNVLIFKMGSEEKGILG